ncbi:MAG TPA: TolC family protein [Puia sp.]|nr:TolC family protein [Puia sp.]
MINEEKATRQEASKFWGCFTLLMFLSSFSTQPLPAQTQPSTALTPGPSTQAQSFTLEQCYQLAEATYPLSRQRGLIEKTKEYTIENLSKGVYPQFNVSGTATYQSDVTKISVPGYTIPTVSKDQYKLYGEVSQTLSDFGINHQKKELSRTDAAIQEENLNTELFKLKDRINQLFFGALLIDGQLEQNDLSKKDIQTGMAKVQAAINNGTDFNSSLNKLKAELLKTDQHTIELKASRKAYTDMLSLFLNQPITETTVLVKPQPPALNDSINRPELRAYDLQTKSYLQQRHLTKINNFPQLSAFFQGGLGKPSPVNFLSTDLTGYYLTGLRLSWNIGGLYTYRKDQLINKNNQDMVETQRSTFLFNTHLTLRQQNADIVRYQQLIQSDNEIVKLRASVKSTSAVQLENGVITTNDYLNDINAEAQARQDRVLHEIQLLISEYDHKTTSGN